MVNGYDIFAWIVPTVLAVVLLVVWLMGSAAGHVARRRGHPWCRGHLIRRVLLRQVAILDYINPF